MARTRKGFSKLPQFKTAPNRTINIPDAYSINEFDTTMWLYQGIGLSSPQIAPDDYKKIEGASGRNPLRTQRICTLF